MLNILSLVQNADIFFGFGDGPNGNPAFYVFGFPVYLYAIFIVTGMCLCILIGAFLFKKRGYDPYDICIYALAVIPAGLLGARMYVYIFPWAGQASDWTTFFDFRDGGLGIYGGVILGYLAGFVTCTVRKQNFRIIADSIMPGLLLAQSIGRWGNYVNQEAYGPIITDPAWQWFPYGVQIGTEWHQATFFYESVATFAGFIICLLLMRSKHYKLGWLTSFYGIYYGIVRLIIEGLRTDSLYLWIGNTQTDIKISQLVSVFTIILGIWGLTVMYRKELHALYSKMFKTERQEVAQSRWVLTALVAVCIVVSIVMYVLGGESKFLIGLTLDCVAVYAFVGIFALNDRLQLYCSKCGERINVEQTRFLTERENLTLTKLKYIIMIGVLVFVGILLLILGLVVTYVDNHVVFGIMLLVVALFYGYMLDQTVKKLNKEQIAQQRLQLSTQSEQISCQCGEQQDVKLNKVLLFLYPFKVYPDYGVSHLKPWVDPEKDKKKNKKVTSTSQD